MQVLDSDNTMITARNDTQKAAYVSESRPLLSPIGGCNQQLRASPSHGRLLNYA